MKKARQKVNDRIINLFGQPFHIIGGLYQGKEKAKRYADRDCEMQKIGKSVHYPYE